MTVRQLIAALLARTGGDVDLEVFMHPMVESVDAVEVMPGDATYDLLPYVVLRGER